MPIGPNREKRPSNPNAMSTMVARIAAGRSKETYANEKPLPQDQIGAKRSIETEEEQTEQPD